MNGGELREENEPNNLTFLQKKRPQIHKMLCILRAFMIQCKQV